MQGRSAFKHAHAMLAGLYTQQRKLILGPGQKELAKEAGEYAYERHCAVVERLLPYVMLLSRPFYHGLQKSVKKTFKAPGNRCCPVLYCAQMTALRRVCCFLESSF
jgi:hypothetical protein